MHKCSGFSVPFVPAIKGVFKKRMARDRIIVSMSRMREMYIWYEEKRIYWKNVSY